MNAWKFASILVYLNIFTFPYLGLSVKALITLKLFIMFHASYNKLTTVYIHFGLASYQSQLCLQ